MQGKTHLVIGIAAALAILYPETPRQLVAGCGCAALGSMISDIDSAPSHAGQHAVKAAAACVMIVIATFVADAYFHTGLYEFLLQENGRSRRLLAALAFLFLSAFGMLTSHRAFMHSISGGILLALCIREILPEETWYFAIGFGIHLVLDLMNRKGIRLFYPLRKKYCLGWYKANGFADRVLFMTGTAAMILLVYRSAAPWMTGFGPGNIMLFLNEKASQLQQLFQASS